MSTITTRAAKPATAPQAKPAAAAAKAAARPMATINTKDSFVASPKLIAMHAPDFPSIIQGNTGNLVSAFRAAVISNNGGSFSAAPRPGLVPSGAGSMVPRA